MTVSYEWKIYFELFSQLEKQENVSYLSKIKFHLPENLQICFCAIFCFETNLANIYKNCKDLSLYLLSFKDTKVR